MLAIHEYIGIRFGDTLRQSREALRLTLDSAAYTTKISKRYLHALESEDLDKLPGGVFRHGFLRSYADYLHLDPRPLIAAMDALATDTQEIITPDRDPRPSLVRVLFR